MGTLVGHVVPGFGFMLIGLWHLFNHAKLHARHSNSYASSPWFPTTLLRHLELLLIMAGAGISISMELVIGPERHQPFDPDGSIPSNHLHNFEHASISFSFFTYALAALLLDKLWPKLPAVEEITQLLAGLAFGQQLLLFHLHSADHMGPEGQYHLLLQLLVLISVVTTLMGIGLQRSFITSYVRSLSIFFQGFWFVLMGFMLWTPALIPKGCRINSEDGHQVVRCDGEMALHRAKSLVNLQFSWCITAMAVFGVVFYVAMVAIYGEKSTYVIMNKEEEEEEEEEEVDLELEKGRSEARRSFLEMSSTKTYSPIDMER